MLSMLSYEVDVTINPLNKIPIYIILYTLLWEQWHIKWLIFITSSFWFLWLYDYITYYILLYLHISCIHVSNMYMIFFLYLLYMFFLKYIYIYIQRIFSWSNLAQATLSSDADGWLSTSRLSKVGKARAAGEHNPPAQDRQQIFSKFWNPCVFNFGNIWLYTYIYIIYYHIIILKCLNKHTAYKIQAHDIINFDDHTMYMPFTFYFLILNDVMICTYQIFNYLEVKNQRFIYNMQ